MGMYEVCAKCGHVGRNNYIEKIFAIEAIDGKEAARLVRMMPRVKHDHKDAIRYVYKITSERFAEINERNSKDPYFFCNNIQEQREKCDIEPFEERANIVQARTARQSKKYYYKKEEIRNPKKYMTMYVY